MSTFDEFIVCPYCGEKDEETTDYPDSLRHDGDSAQTYCSECEREFKVTICVSYMYQGEKL